MKSDGLSASSSSSSSIGIAGESSGSGEKCEDGEVESKMRRDSLGSMNSLEDSLPVNDRRGLSEFLKETSRSFASLSDVVTASLTAGDLVNPENQFNKRMRILLAIKFRRASCSSLFPYGCQLQLSSSCSCSSANLFSLVEDEEEEKEEPKKGGESSTSPTSLGPLNSSCSASSLSSLSSSSSIFFFRCYEF